MADKVTIATRGQQAALIQTEWVAGKLREFHPGLDVHIEIIKTTGDKIQSAPFAQVGSMGIFVKEIEGSLVDGRADIAVHSLKDVQTVVHPELEIAATPERESARDVLISRDGLRLDVMLEGSIIGTSSARRRGLIAAEKRGLEVRECRGNLTKRVEKLRAGEFDAILLAEAGLRRMGMTDLISDYLDVSRFVPAVGQGALGIEIRKDDRWVSDLVMPLNHRQTFSACTEEREFLAAIGGGCHAPVGGYLYYRDDEAIFLAYAGTGDGTWFTKRILRSSAADMRGIGLKMAEGIKALPGSEAFFEEVARDA